MKFHHVFIFCCIFLTSFAQAQHPLSIQLSVSEHLQEDFKPDGRLLIFLNQIPGFEPRFAIWPNSGSYLFGKNFKDVKATEKIMINNTEGWQAAQDWTLENIPEGKYTVQLVWDHDVSESRIDAPGILYTTPVELDMDQARTIEVKLDSKIKERKVIEHELVKVIDMKSETLSKWWGRPVSLKATVLLPADYDKNKAYPVRYNVAGYGGRYTRINRIAGNDQFMEWWQSAEAPRVITVYLDGEGPFGDSYQMDSENSGPYGEALIRELIPYIESTYRGTNSAETRFVDGCSTGGWVSLALQLYYPEMFNGVFSYSPDAVEFENYQLINIYKDKNAFINEHGYLRPVARETNGEPFMSLKDFIRYENVLGASNTYLNSGGQFSAHAALYSPKGEDGLPKPLIDPETGDIDPAVAATWKKYDLKLYAKEHWATLGPKLQGKIYIWMGDMDHFYLNPATRAFDAFLQKTENPKSDAVIEFSPMQGHCAQFSDRRVLEQVSERLQELRSEQ